MGVGHVIRYIPSEGSLEYRGYDVSISETIAGRRFNNETIFLRTTEPVPGVVQGDVALVIAEETDLTMVFRPGECVPLRPITESDPDD